MKIPPKKRVAFIAKTRLLVRELFASSEEEAQGLELGGCLYFAATLAMVIKQAGYKGVMFQAGSMSWPRINPKQDDGIIGSHFSYEWQKMSEADKQLVRLKILPEVHCWLAHRAPDTIIDGTTGTLPDRCRNMGMVWSSPNPPNFLWVTTRELRKLSKSHFPLGIAYNPNPEATMYLDGIAEKVIYPKVYEKLKAR